MKQLSNIETKFSGLMAVDIRSCPASTDLNPIMGSL